MLPIRGKTVETEGSDPPLSRRECKRGSRHHWWRESHAPLEAEVLGSSLGPTTCHIIIGNLSISKYLIYKMGTSIMVLSATAAWARNKGQSA